MELAFKLVALVVYFGGMIGIGLYAFRKTEGGEDYMLGGRQLHPFVAALSAGASDMSGWLLMGLPGALYMSGMVEAWIAIGLTVGAGLNWIFVAPRLRQYTQIADNAITVPSYFGNRLHDRTNILRIAAGLIILVFFTFYVSSGMVAGGVFFQSMFGGPYLVGMLLVGGVTIVYTLFGGFLGASYTDVVQGLIMLVSLLVVPITAMVVVGGPVAMLESVREVDANFGSMTAGGPSSASSPRSPGGWATSGSPTSSCASWRCAPRAMPGTASWWACPGWCCACSAPCSPPSRAWPSSSRTRTPSSPTRRTASPCSWTSRRSCSTR